MRGIDHRPLRATALALACAGLLTGCADTGVELNGKIFDAVGVGTNSKKAQEAKLEPRVPLVPPPHTGALPVPGQTTDQHMAWPTDPEKKQRQVALTAEQKRQRECDEQKKFGTASERRADSDLSRSCGSIWDWVNPNSSNVSYTRATEQQQKQSPR